MLFFYLFFFFAEPSSSVTLLEMRILPSNTCNLCRGLVVLIPIIPKVSINMRFSFFVQKRIGVALVNPSMFFTVPSDCVLPVLYHGIGSNVVLPPPGVVPPLGLSCACKFIVTATKKTMAIIVKYFFFIFLSFNNLTFLLVFNCHDAANIQQFIVLQ